jgi:hypothetical protein
MKTEPKNANNYRGPDIVVTIPKKRLASVEAEEQRVQRAIERGQDGWRYFWKMGRLPKKKPRRVYFLWDGAVRAYHETLFMEGGDIGFINGNITRIWLRPKIHEISPIPMSPFRGFRYFASAASTKEEG